MVTGEMKGVGDVYTDGSGNKHIRSVRPYDIYKGGVFNAICNNTVLETLLGLAVSCKFLDKVSGIDSNSDTSDVLIPDYELGQFSERDEDAVIRFRNARSTAIAYKIMMYSIIKHIDGDEYLKSIFGKSVFYRMYGREYITLYELHCLIIELSIVSDTIDYFGSDGYYDYDIISMEEHGKYIRPSDYKESGNNKISKLKKLISLIVPGLKNVVNTIVLYPDEVFKEVVHIYRGKFNKDGIRLKDKENSE